MADPESRWIRRSLATLLTGHAGVQDRDTLFCGRCFGYSHAPCTILEHAGQSSEVQTGTETASVSFRSRFFSTGTRDADRLLEMICRPPGQRLLRTRTVMSHHVDEEQQIKFSELSNIEHRVQDRKNYSGFVIDRSPGRQNGGWSWPIALCCFRNSCSQRLP